MAVSGEVFEQDGGVKLHPYIIALARWCVSCLWSTATAMLYRLLANPLPQITAPKQSKPRPAGKEHLHPEPRVECVVLHQPATPKVDVIFVHGLYGSLGNTWRQGEWRSKYKIEPNTISLRRPNSIPACDCSKQIDKDTDNDIYNENTDFKDNNKIESIKNSIKEENENILNFKDKEITFTNIDEYYKKRRITDDEMFITEKFYKEVDQCEVIDDYDTQAKFVRDLFNMENLKAEKKENDNCRCRAEEKRCEVGCGCICDECYSECWPRDWIKEDYPHARVISINYTSDPHLWRPLWIKQCKRLHLHERAEQMTAQLLALGVGERPIVWVGHSKGGLFIKQIYCEAYEAYKKLNGNNTEAMNDNTQIKQNCEEYDKDNEMNEMIDGTDNENICTSETDLELYTGNEGIYDGSKVSIDNKDVRITDYSNEVNDNPKNKLDDINDIYDDSSLGESNCDIAGATDGDSTKSSNDEEELGRRALLWSQSSGFMFYSVPHRGSPLADIKTPFTARSVELLEMGQDCSLVTRLHARWLAAAAAAPARVRSLVETTRTLMAVLWLRIVSADSADAGIGALCGVSVDHREICKPSSRHCILYTELMALIHTALSKCQQ